MMPALFQHSGKQILTRIDRWLGSRRTRAILLGTLMILLMAATGAPQAAYQAAATETPSSTPTVLGVTPTPQPTRLRPTQTPLPIPPADQIGSTDGIIGLGVVIVAIILGAMLWHRQDWARRRPPRENQSKGG